jgi:hypothetical protein
VRVRLRGRERERLLDGVRVRVRVFETVRVRLGVEGRVREGEYDADGLGDDVCE